MSHKKHYILNLFVNGIVLLVLISAVGIPFRLYAENQSISRLSSLKISDSTIKKIRHDIRHSIYITKSKRNPGLLPALRFYKYKVKRGDTFWKILSSTSLNIDTLMTVNSLSSPLDITPGKTIFIPNMRGIVYKNEKHISVSAIARKFRIGVHYINQANKLGSSHRCSYVFVPTAKVSRIERSLFLGTGFMMPVRKGRKTSGFGMRRDPFNHRLQFHKGIDIACPRGTRVYAARGGYVSSAGYNGGYGLSVTIRHPHGYYSIYGHLSRILIRKGQRVNTGTLIGRSGNTGRSTGPHLHFEVRKNNRAINPFVLSQH